MVNGNNGISSVAQKYFLGISVTTFQTNFDLADKF